MSDSAVNGNTCWVTNENNLDILVSAPLDHQSYTPVYYKDIDMNDTAGKTMTLRISCIRDRY